MRMIARIFVGVVVSVLTMIVLEYFHCREFTQGLWAGSFGIMASDIVERIQKMK